MQNLFIPLLHSSYKSFEKDSGAEGIEAAPHVIMETYMANT